MAAAKPAPKPATVAFVFDERLSRQRAAILTRIVNSMRQCAKIELISGKIPEDDLLRKLETTQYDLVLAPWYRYLAWSKIEGFYGLTRTSGPTFAGYFCESILPYELGEQAEHFRAILLDFCNLDTAAARLLVRSLLRDDLRTGILPLLAQGTTVYCESWHQQQGMGHVFDSVLSLPEVAQGPWAARIRGIRVCLGALWGLIFEEGPGKGDRRASSGATRPARAYFQIGIDNAAIMIRLCYPHPGSSPRDALTTFWPDARLGANPAQLLLRHADFVRVHHVPEPSDMEVTIGFFSTSPVAESFHGQVHTLWVEPVSASTVTELPFEQGPPQPGSQLKPLPAAATTQASAEPKAGGERTAGAGKAHRFILEAAAKIRELKAAITERDNIIRELRSGGVGTARALPPPDVESLIEAFQERYLATGFQIEQFTDQIAQLERDGATPQEVELLRQKMQALQQKQQAWVRQIAGTIELLRESTRKKASGGG